MKAQATTEPHRPPEPQQGPSPVEAWLVAFPVPCLVPLPKAGVPVGREYFASFGLVDPQISGQHIQLSRAGGVLRVEDLGSRNGTFLDGYRLPARDLTPLSDGDILRLGDSLLVYRDAFLGPQTPALPEGGIVGPWGLSSVRQALSELSRRPEKAVLLLGETGTGKELLSRSVACALGREKPFAPVNVAALSPSTLEGHLFGWKKGAFSGADRTDVGLIRANDKGTVFLDEIGELPAALSAKLLRVLENGEVLGIGEHQPHQVDVAFVAATNRDLDALAAEKHLRPDLLARFRSRITISPVRDRVEDLFSLIVALWERRNGPADLAQARKSHLIEVEAVERLMLHDWPGNIRDLERFIALLPPDRLELKWVMTDRFQDLSPEPRGKKPPTVQAVKEALAACDGNQLKAAKALGIDRGRVQRILKKHPELRLPPSGKK